MTTPLVLLHGFLGCAEDWEETMEALSPPMPCLAIDLPGHGEGAEPMPEDATFEEVVAGLHHHLAEIETPKLDLLGYSMGGRLALGLIAMFPERFRRAVIVGASPGIDDEEERASRAALDDLRSTALVTVPFAAWLDDWYAQPLFDSLRESPRFAAVLERRLRGEPAALASAVKILSPGRQPPLRQALEDCPVPALLLAGSADATYASIGRELAEANPAFEAATIPDAGHAPHLENPDDFLHAVRHFLGP